MADPILEWAVDRLLATPPIVALTSNRIYIGDSGQIGESDYPAITLSRRLGMQDVQAPIAEFTMSLSTWCEVTDTAWNLWEMANSVLDGVRGNLSGLNWIIRQESTPLQMPGGTAKKTYRVVGLMLVNQFGKLATGISPAPDVSGIGIITALAPVSEVPTPVGPLPTTNFTLTYQYASPPAIYLNGARLRLVGSSPQVGEATISGLSLQFGRAIKSTDYVLVEGYVNE